MWRLLVAELGVPGHQVFLEAILNLCEKYGIKDTSKSSDLGDDESKPGQDGKDAR